MDGLLRGYVVVDVTHERMQADWYYVPTVTAKDDTETFGKGLVSVAGSPHLVEAATPAAQKSSAAPAPLEV